MWFLLLAVLSASFISSESLLRERTIRRDVRLLEKVKAGPSQLELLASQFAVTPSRLSQGDVSSNEEYVTRRRRSSDDCGMPQILNIDPVRKLIISVGIEFLMSVFSLPTIPVKTKHH